MTKEKEVLKGIVGNVRNLYIFIALIGIAVIGGVVWLQFGPNSEKYKKKAHEVSFSMDSLVAKRGSILSDDGRILATTMPYYEIRMDTRAKGLDSALFYQNVAELADRLSELFKDKPASQYKEQLIWAHKIKHGYLQFCPRWVDYNELQKIKKFPIFKQGAYKGGFIVVAHNIRIRPYDSLALRTVGYFSKADDWVGLEKGLDSLLRGSPGKQRTQKISGKFKIPIPSLENVDPIDGADVVSTLNIELQAFAQNALVKQMASLNATMGTAIVMETATGHIKAIANASRLKSGKYVEQFNTALRMTIEPGSTFKIATLLALIDDAHVSMNEMVSTDGGVATVGGIKVSDATSGGYGTISLHTAFVKSSNVAMAKLVNKYYARQPSKYVEIIKKLGFGQNLGLPIPGTETPVILYSPASAVSNITSLSYGYAIKVSPIQILTFCNAIANGGVMVKPQFVKEMHFGKDSIYIKPTEIINSKIASDKAIRQVRSAMEDVVQHGTATTLKNDNYTIAAKTGTARVWNEKTKRYEHDSGRDYLGTVVGYMPADNPKYTIIVSIMVFRAEGSAGKYYGGATAAPVFKDIANYIYNSNFEFAKHVKRQTPILTEKLRVKEDNKGQAKYVLESLGISPASMMLDRSIQRADKDSAVKIPYSPYDVRGLTLTKAITRLERAGYTVQTQGRGVVVKQEMDSLSKNVRIYLQYPPPKRL